MPFRFTLIFPVIPDMAIGMGRMMGFHYLENFDDPYSDFGHRFLAALAHIHINIFPRLCISLSAVTACQNRAG